MKKPKIKPDKTNSERLLYITMKIQSTFTTTGDVEIRPELPKGCVGWSLVFDSAEDALACCGENTQLALVKESK